MNKTFHSVLILPEMMLAFDQHQMPAEFRHYLIVVVSVAYHVYNY